MKLDAKFEGVIIKAKDATVVPSDQYIVFLAKDDALPRTLEFYEQECIRVGCSNEQVEAIRSMRARVETWRASNQHLCKIPDIDPGEKLLVQDV